MLEATALVRPPPRADKPVTVAVVLDLKAAERLQQVVVLRGGVCERAARARGDGRSPVGVVVRVL